MAQSKEPRADRPGIRGYGIPAATEGKGLFPWSWAVERLVASHNYWVSSTRPSGAPHAMPVWAVWLDDRLIFSTAYTSRKARNLAADARCVVTTERADEAVIVEGIAGREADPVVLGRFKAIYDAKYHWDMDVTREPMWVIEPRVVFGFIETEGDFAATATRWTFEGRSDALSRGASSPRR